MLIIFDFGTKVLEYKTSYKTHGIVRFGTRFYNAVSLYQKVGNEHVEVCLSTYTESSKKTDCKIEHLVTSSICDFKAIVKDSE